MLESTSKFTVVEIVCRNDHEGFAVAKGYWAGDKSRHRLAVRWFEDDGIGYPQTYGKPQWCLLPDSCTAQFEGLIPGNRTATLTFVETPPSDTPAGEPTAAKMTADE